MMILSCERMVYGFARKLARECPELDFNDIKGDLWIVALDSLKRWNGKDKSKFSTFLFNRLVWKRLNILKTVINHGRLDRWFEGLLDFEVPPIERSFDTLCRQVASKLGEDERRLFSLMVDPSPGLLEAASKSKTRFSQDKICYHHYRLLLGWKRGKVWYAIKKIKLAVAEVVNG